ncbi:MAG: TRAP transporter substrate-binding protein [Gammaproteobacteria bacterium]|nr:TRAP transporter substrate-binding protein [Gammaproteobacteria bacterium]NIR85415.1 TRAP transporter substrate-binding protein [Gammaproteobacteria bacterium]NIR89106.1 TRAP transporter substrate-binding protein [Gammaproteobacteria bacterium]NIU06551.1 TRAP transporter substrate-binding protein [Gammaproteobacteria bacterium]NIX87824.1 ABC transporter substrate-binding protein [Gammaproteobacteria bacterium]
MVTDYPDGPGMLPSARRLVQTISDASGGRIRIEVSAAGAVVRPFETFDAVQAGVADMFGSHIGYFEKKSPAFHFYSGVPFGFTANELFAWVRFGGGQELWDELSGEFDIKPLLCCSTGAQMGGWFVNEITSIEDLKGLRYRMAEPAAEVFRRLGAIVVLVPGSEIVQSLRSGAIDACEWIGPWLDTSMGLHQAAGFYYYPSWHEPGSALTLGINRRVWESLEEGDRRLVESAAAGEYAASLAEFNTNNALALRRLRAQGTVRIRRFDDAILKTFAEISNDLVAEVGSGDDLSRKIYRSYLEFRSLIRGWSDIGEGAYLGIREFG